MLVTDTENKGLIPVRFVKLKMRRVKRKREKKKKKRAILEEEKKKKTNFIIFTGEGA